MIAILAPMRDEVGLLFEKLEDPLIIKGLGKKYTLGTLGDKEVGLFCCGIGRDQAAIWLRFIHEKYSPRGLILGGTAGALSEDAVIGDLVVASGFFLDGKPDYVPCSPPDFIDKILPSSETRREPVLTADRVVMEKSLRRKLNKNYDAFCVEMEGYEAARFCREKDLPFVGLRVVSDSADENIYSDFRKNLDFVVRKLNDAIMKIVLQWPAG